MSGKNPSPATNYAWVRARCLGAKQNIWAGSLCASPTYDFKAKDRDGFGENWPSAYSDNRSLLTQSRSILGITGVKEISRIFPTASSSVPPSLNCAEVTLKDSLAKMAASFRNIAPGSPPMDSSTISTAALLRPRRLRKQGRLRHPRRFRFTYEAGLIYPRDGHRKSGPCALMRLCAKSQLIRKPAKPAAYAFIDNQTLKGLRRPCQGRHRGRFHPLESARLLLLSKSATSQRLGPTQSAMSAITIFVNTSWAPASAGRAKNLVR